MADPTTQRDLERDLDHELERIRVHRSALRNRHSRELSKLMTKRGDLKGVHALADLVADSLQWSA